MNKETQFVLPKGYVAWCHICAKEPFNRLTVVDGEAIPGVGFKTLAEGREHDRDLHRVWKG